MKSIQQTAEAPRFYRVMERLLGRQDPRVFPEIECGLPLIQLRHEIDSFFPVDLFIDVKEFP